MPRSAKMMVRFMPEEIELVRAASRKSARAPAEWVHLVAVGFAQGRPEPVPPDEALALKERVYAWWVSLAEPIRVKVVEVALGLQHAYQAHALPDGSIPSPFGNLRNSFEPPDTPRKSAAKSRPRTTGRGPGK